VIQVAWHWSGVWHWASWAMAAIALTGITQVLLGTAAARLFLPSAARRPARETNLPRVTVLKPLHGAEPLLARALETFFRQDYPGFQIIFGVQSAADPAIAVVNALCQRYPQVDAALVVNPRPHGTNRKIANLINMFPTARHDILVVSDSDMHVAPDYLRQVVRVLGQPGVGLATTIYTGLPAGPSLTAQLGAAYINQIFSSGALLARFLGRQDCLGATMALTRSTLMQIGGFPGLSPFVADDGVLGRRVRALGQQVRLAPTVPATTVSEASLPALFRHELRWARTIRAMAPIGFILSALQYPVFWALLATLFSAGKLWALALLLGTALVRAACGRVIERSLGAAPTALALAPVRDLLSVAVMAAAFFDDEVAWRGQVLSTAPDRALAQGQFSTGTAGFARTPPVLAHGKG
jgi:ceramide glucosyltransferase